MFVFLLIFL